MVWSVIVSFHHHIINIDKLIKRILLGNTNARLRRQYANNSFLNTSAKKARRGSTRVINLQVTGMDLALSTTRREESTVDSGLRARWRERVCCIIQAVR
jgi:hypothetical protein